MGGCLSKGTESPTKAEDEQKLEINHQNGNPAAKTLSARGTGGGKDNHAFTDNDTLQQSNQVIIGSTFQTIFILQFFADTTHLWGYFLRVLSIFLFLFLKTLKIIL